MDNSVNDIRDLAIMATEGAEVGGVPYVIVPEKHRFESLEGHLQHPARKRTDLDFADLPSLCFYINKHKAGDASVVYFDRAHRVFDAVLNDDSKDTPGWRDHIASLTLQFSRQFKAWSNAAERSQKEFAEFLEDRLHEIAVPDGATLMGIVTNLEASQSASFASSTRLSNGDTKFVYQRETKAGAGELSLPEKITLSIPVWDGGNPVAVVVKVRYRLAEDKLRLRVEIERLEDLIDAEVDNAIEYVSEKTALPILRYKR